MTSQLESSMGSLGILLLITAPLIFFRKPHSEHVTGMTPELDASEGIFLFLTTLSELIRKPYLELMILMTSRLESSMAQNSLETNA